MLDVTEDSIIWRIRDAMRHLGSIIPNLTSAPLAPDREGRLHQWRQSIIPQRASKLAVAHSAIENGLKHLINKRKGNYKHKHDLAGLLDELRACNPEVAASLDSAFAAAAEFYGTDTQHPAYRHLASLPDYLEKVGSKKHFELLRYVGLESSIDDPALEYVHMEFHYEILCALDEAIRPRYGTIANRVEYFARLAFLDSPLLESLASHSAASKEAYVGWLEEQDTYVEAIRKLTTRRNAISNEHANCAAIDVCYKLTGSEDLALRTIAHGFVLSELTQHGEIETRVSRPKEVKNQLVTTPAGDLLGYIRHLPTGFWLATDDIYSTNPAWFRTERDARLYLARLFLVELFITTARGSSTYRSVSTKRYRGSEENQRVASSEFNWAEFGKGEIWLKLWDSHHDLQPSEHIDIRAAVNSTKQSSGFYWCGRVAHVAGQNVYVSKAKLQHSQDTRGAELDAWVSSPEE